MKDTTFVCLDCRKEGKCKNESRLVRCECGSLRVLWKEKRTSPILLSHADRLKER